MITTTLTTGRMTRDSAMLVIYDVYQIVTEVKRIH